jgi:predicted porin
VKKTALALLLAGGVISGASAQSNVTVYGIVDLGFAKTTNGTLVERENHASRLGFRGTEDLGNGLSAIFNLENEFLADTGVQKGNLFDRQAWVGFKGSFGTVYVGRTKDIIDGAQTRTDPFGADGVVGKVDEAMMRSGVGASRVSNSLTYQSPTFSGFVFNAQAVLSEVSGANTGYAALLTYDEGALSAQAGYERAAQTVASTTTQTLWSVGGGYKLGDAKVTAAYTKGDTGVATTGEYKSYIVGLAYHVGAGDIKAVIGHQEQNTVKLGDVTTVKEIGLGYDYPLSKRTALYAYTGRERVKSLTSYQVGMTHKF